MFPGARKFVTNQRSVPKQQRASYQQASTGERQFNNPYYVQHSSKKELNKNSSEVQLKHPKEEYFANLNQRRKNEGQMSNLKSQLQNLKNQVNKLISKQSTLRTPVKERISIKEQRSDKKVNYVTKGFHQQYTDKEEDFSDTASMTSVTTEKVLNQPLRRLERKVNSQNFDQGYYMQLQNELLKTEIKNLKNKYVSKKRQLSEKCDLLEKKNQFLEISLQKSQQSLIECRKALEMEIMVIKKQITLKTQIRNQNEPQTDKIQVEGNDVLKDKIKKLYEQLIDKNKIINNFNIQIGDFDAMLERKKFQLKKQTQKNLELSKQIELSKRENSRLQQLIETELSKKKDLQRQNDALKEKSKELMSEIYAKEQIVSGSEQYQNRLSEELQGYKKKQEQLQLKLTSLKEQNIKQKQIIDSEKDQIAYLKKSNQDTLSRISQLSKKLKQEQEKSFQREDFYRKIIEQNKRKQEQKMKIIKEQYESQTTHINEQITKKQENQGQQVSELLRDKDRQLNKWKAEYKILKLKHQQKQSSEQIKKEEVGQYYKGYIQFRHSSQLLEERNKLLQKSIEKYLKTISQKEAELMKYQIQQTKTIQNLRAQLKNSNHELDSLNEELSETKNQLSEFALKNEQEIKYRQDTEQKIQKFIQKQLKGESSQDEEDHFEDIQNLDQQKTPQKSKKFLQDETESPNPSSPNRPTRKEVKSKTYQPPVLSQSQKLQLQQLSEAINSIKKRVIQQDQKLSKNIKQLKNKDNQIVKLRKQIRQLLQTHEKQLLQMKERYSSQKLQANLKTSMESQKKLKQIFQQQVELRKIKETELLRQNVSMKSKLTQIEKELLDLRQETKSLSHLYNVKCSDVEDVMEKSLQQNIQKDKKLDQMQLIKNQRQTNFINQINSLKDQIFTLRLDIKNLISLNQKIQTHNFDEALKNQIESNKKLREELSKKNEQVFKVRDNYTLVRSQYDNLRSENEIEKLKSISQKKNLQIQYQIEIQNLKNRFSVEEKKVTSLEQKIALVIEENKKKDSFIQSYIMGKKLPQGDKQFLAEFIKHYQIQLNGKNINEKLRGDSQELQKMITYNYRLLKDMADMKQKMLLYETMEGEAISLYDSKRSGQANRQRQDFDSPNSSNNSPRTPSKRFKKMSSLVDSQDYLQ